MPWWSGAAAKPRLLEAAARRQLPVLQVEDGFLRQLDLSDLVDPVSGWWITRASITTPPGPAIWKPPGDAAVDVGSMPAAAALRQRLVKEAITKYNLQRNLGFVLLERTGWCW